MTQKPKRPSRVIGEVRRSQVITTYGVGALVAVGDQSYVVAGIDSWGVVGPDLHEPRLEKILGVSGFARPPAALKEDSENIPVVLFPKYYNCPGDCSRLAPHGHMTAPGKNRCNRCNEKLVPARFVSACTAGHIDDFPWLAWVHGGAIDRDKKHALRLTTSGNTASLAGISIKCTCGASATMEGAFHRNALAKVAHVRCQGPRPWLGDQEECTETPQTLQRGASNVWFSQVRSALSIPPWSEGVFDRLNQHWHILKVMPITALEPTILGLGLSDDRFSPKDLVEAVVRRREAPGDGSDDEAGLREGEYQALELGQPERSSTQQFVCVPGTLGPTGSRYFDKAMLVKRLREVRALTGFTRLSSSGGVAPLAAEAPNWLPGMEVMGEGVFLRLDEARLKNWESKREVTTRVDVLSKRYASHCESRKRPVDRTITPRLVLIHTVAHAIINQWSLDCGYPAASLRELLYVSPEMRGLLIYTATSDSAGSLGGVIEQAYPDRLDDAISECIHRAGWCSSDPVCIEARATGADSLNMGACHACVLLPEVSCEERNLFLDRALLVGTPTAPDLGYFHEPD